MNLFYCSSSNSNRSFKHFTALGGVVSGEGFTTPPKHAEMGREGDTGIHAQIWSIQLTGELTQRLIIGT